MRLRWGIDKMGGSLLNAMKVVVSRFIDLF